MNFWIIFLTGLTSGGFSCAAVQGGLLTSVIANQKNKELHASKTQSDTRPTSFDVLDWLPVVVFLVAKLIVHTILGFFLGLLGSKLALRVEVQLVFQVLTALFMFATAMNLLHVHPIFRYVVFQPPRFIQRIIRNTSKGSALFTPAVLGVISIFIPCGVTQAMEVLAMSTGNPIYGALTMFFFVLGTSPLFALIGVATAKLSEVWNTWFMYVAASILIVMSIFSVNGVLTVLDAPVTLQKIGSEITSIGAPPKQLSGQQDVPIENGVQKVVIQITNNGYSPTHFTVKKNIPVELTLETNGVYSCASSFTFKQFEIYEQLRPKDSKTVTFTPTQTGKFSFSCSMGMYSGVMEVK